ncbi:MAG TPA: HAMP domain-containing sensor histidine kinase [Candidatus Paceibacterota bacterium]|nr:HAMP domain-containing sensor histidine kinase [Candidatus Paceibacterota bacterium]
MKNFLSFLFVFIVVAGIVCVSFYGEIIMTHFSVSFHIAISFLFLVSFLFAYFYWRTLRDNENIKNEFITIVTHKFRTPLTSVKWTIESLKKNITLEEKQNSINELTRASENLLEMVDMLVNFTKFDKGSEYAYKAVSFRDIVEKTLVKYSDFLKQKKVHFIMEPVSGLPLIIIDESKIQFVIDVVFDNAIRYTPEGGTVHVRIIDTKKFLVFSIEDTGIGMRSRDRHKVSKRFFRTEKARTMHTEGLGMGLYIAKKIIKRHKGTLSVTSKGENKGTTVSIEIPKH